MVGALAPIAIVLGGAAAMAFIFASFWGRIVGPLRGFGSFYTRELDISGLNIKSTDLGYVVITVVALAWIGLVIAFTPGVLVGIIMFPMVLGLGGYGVKYYLRLRVDRTVKEFRNQLEVVLRSLSSGVRVGLGLRQALLLVAEQSKDPARKELTRVIGAANLGTSVLDALDEMAARMPMSETQMLARVVRVQARSGGNLAQVLEGIAETIRDRRRLDRKIDGLTAQARASAWVLGGLPIVMCAFLLLTQETMRVAALHTGIGNFCLVFGIGLDAAAVVVLLKISSFDA
jgi:tight adherence protein B